MLLKMSTKEFTLYDNLIEEITWKLHKKTTKMKNSN